MMAHYDGHTEAAREQYISKLEAHVREVEAKLRQVEEDEADSKEENDMLTFVSHVNVNQSVEIGNLKDKLRQVEAERDQARAALRDISEATFCHGPGCPHCASDTPHPKSWEAQRAKQALGEE